MEKPACWLAGLMHIQNTQDGRCGWRESSEPCVFGVEPEGVTNCLLVKLFQLLCQVELVSKGCLECCIT